MQVAVDALVDKYYKPLDRAQLYGDAWDGAAQMLKDRGVTGVPNSPTYPADRAAAALVQNATFSELERLAVGKVTPAELTAAAITQLAGRRGDCHTRFISAGQAPPAPGARTGMTLSDTPPLRILDVLPGGPADLAGLRVGMRIVAIDNQPSADLTGEQAIALANLRDGVPITFQVQQPGGAVNQVRVTPARLPLVFKAVLAGKIGLLRFDFLPASATDLDSQLRAALADFEKQGVTGWVLDLRHNVGGSRASLDAVARLLVAKSATLYQTVGRDGVVRAVGANGSALAAERPMAVLVNGTQTMSGAEMLAAILQANANATVVGDKTKGCFAVAAIITLPDGSGLSVTSSEVLIGAGGRHFNGIGLTPDVPVQLTADDLDAGRDPQLDTAVKALTR